MNHLVGGRDGSVELQDRLLVDEKLVRNFRHSPDSLPSFHSWQTNTQMKCCGTGSGRIRNFLSSSDLWYLSVYGSGSRDRTELFYSIIWTHFAIFHQKIVTLFITEKLWNSCCSPVFIETGLVLGSVLYEKRVRRYDPDLEHKMPNPQQSKNLQHRNSLFPLL